MRDLDRLAVWIQAALTRLFIWFPQRGRYEGTKEASFVEDPTTLYTFRKDGPPIAQTTLFGTIIWNETYTEQLSPLAKSVVFHHECSHRDRNPVFKGALLGMMVCCLGGFGVLLLVAEAFIAGASMSELVIPTLAGLGMIGTFGLLFRIEETLAHYDALLVVGEKKFLEACEEIAEVSSDGFFQRALSKVGYTHPRNVVRLHHLLRHSDNA